MEADKTPQIIAYIVEKMPGVSITSIMKLCYFVDLISVKECGKPLTRFQYRGYYYGPFDRKIYTEIETLVDGNIVVPKSGYVISEEYIGYYYNEDIDSQISLPEKDQELIDRVLKQLEGYGAKALSEIAYKTKPMLAIGAVMGGKEHINKDIDLAAQ